VAITVDGIHSVIPLRDYQQNAIIDCRAAMRQHDKILLVAPTGTGKTRMAAAITEAAVGKGSRVTTLAHRTELIDQMASTLAGYGLDVGVIAAGSRMRANPDALVQAASIQTLLARPDSLPHCDLLIVDEAHHMSEEGAPEFTGLLKRLECRKALGLTATPERGDGAGLGPKWEHIVESITTREAMAQGYLVPCDVVAPDAVLERGRLAMEPLVAYRMHAMGRQGFLFARSVNRALEYAEEFSSAGVKSRCIHAGTPQDERLETLAGFRAGDVRVITNIYVMTEGVDLPAASVCIVATTIGSMGGYIQRVGRVLRTAPGKSDALLIDLVGCKHIWGNPEDERLYSLEGRGIRKAAMLCAVCKKAIEEYPCPNCGYQPQASEGAEDAPDEITHDPLVRYARKRAEVDEAREATLERWYLHALIKGWKTGSAAHKYQVVYGEWPPRDMAGRALDRARAKHAGMRIEMDVSRA
jgi:superfamily II DNA or RNA helicase